MKINVNDIVGKKFGKLTVLELHHKEQLYLSDGIKNGFKYFYLCQCDCGNQIVVASNHFKYGHTNSCGCITNKHNLSESRIFKLYSGIKQRCYNPKCPNFKNYGKRNITICDEWLHNFIAFYDWAIANGYNDTLTIDRIDVNGNYCPDNCRWVNMKTQQNNRTNNHLLTYNGVTHTINEWSEILGINRQTIKSRLHYGWSVEKTLTTPVSHS